MQVRYMPAQTPAQAAGEPGSTPIILCFIESILPADSISMRSRAFALKKPPDNPFCRKIPLIGRIPQAFFPQKPYPKFHLNYTI